MPSNDELMSGDPIAAWMLVAEFWPLADQADAEPAHAFPNDDATRFIAHMCERWGVGPDELQESVGWSETTVVVHAEVIDAFVGLHDWLIMHTRPRQVTITCHEEQG